MLQKNVGVVESEELLRCKSLARLCLGNIEEIAVKYNSKGDMNGG